MVTPDPIESFGKGQSHYTQQFVKSAINGRGTRIWSTSLLDNIGDGEVTITSETGAQVTLSCDSVVDMSDMLPNTSLLDGLSGIESI
jgi:hypothetical protein